MNARTSRHRRRRTARALLVAAGWWALLTGLAACDRGAAPVAAPQVVQGEPELPPLALAGAAVSAAEGTLVEAPPPLPPPPEPLPPPAPEEHRITVRSGETLGLYERWSGVPVGDLLEANRLKKARGLRVGQPFVIIMTAEQAVDFSRMRREFHRSREEVFFRTHAIVKLMPYVVQSGDTLPAISTRYSDVPRWLMEKVNRGHDLTHLRAGDIINLPVVREAPPAAARELEARAAAAAADGGADADGFALPAPEGAVQVLSTPLADGGAADPAAAPDLAWGDEAGPGASASATGAGGDGAAPTRQGVTWFSDDDGDGPPPPVVVDVEIKVRKGERVIHYAQWSGTSVDRIARANDLLDPGRLKLGQALKVPVEEARVADFYEQRRVFHNGPDAAPPPPPKRSGDALRAPARPSAAAAGAGTAQTFGYTVRPGETAWEVGVKRFGLTMKQLEEYNPAINLNRLRTGDVLQIPVSVIR